MTLAPTPPWAPSPPTPPPVRSRRGLAAAGVVAVLAIVVGIVAVVGSQGDDDRTADPAAAGEAAADGDDAEGDDELTAALATAGGALTDAGTFSYEATSRLEGPDPTELDETLVIEQEMTGDVVLPGAVRHRVTGEDGVTYEYITIGSDLAVQTWLRDSAYPDQLDDRPWSEIEGSSGELDLARLPEWLSAATDPRDGGEDSDGRRVVAAAIPPRLVDLGPDLTVIDVAVEATVDDSGTPVRVDLQVSTTDTVIEATYDLVRIGHDVEVVAPPATDLDVTPWVNEQDLEAFDGPAPLGLSHIPAGWVLAGAYVTPDPAGGPCPSATVDYTNLDDPIGQFLWIDVMDPGCMDAPLGDALDVAGYTGAVAEEDDGTRWGVVSSGDAVVLFSTDLSVEDLRVVLANLGPLDVTAEPQPLDGIPSTGT